MTGTGTTPTAAQVSARVAALDKTADVLQKTESAVAAIVAQLSRSQSTPTRSGTTSGSGAGSGFASSTGSAAAAPTSTSSTSGSGASPVSSGGSSAVRIASDQVAILQGQQSVTQAQSAVDQATLTAPIAGTVAQIGFAAGQSATTSSGITIVGLGSAALTADVPLADMGSVHSGLAAKVTAAGASATITDTVQSVDLLPADASSTTPACAATILVDDPPTALASAAEASAALQLAPAHVRGNRALRRLSGRPAAPQAAGANWASTRIGRWSLSPCGRVVIEAMSKRTEVAKS